MDITLFTKNFKDIQEWKIFCTAQYKQIITLTQEISDLKDKNKNLEKIVSSTVPLLQDSSQKTSTIQSVAGMSDEEAIAVMEISKLREISLERPLDMAETKQYEIYTKTLQSLKNKKSQGLAETEKLSNEEILKLVDNNG
jgi:hypothetical protein